MYNMTTTVERWFCFPRSEVWVNAACVSEVRSVVRGGVRDPMCDAENDVGVVVRFKDGGSQTYYGITVEEFMKALLEEKTLGG